MIKKNDNEFLNKNPRYLSVQENILEKEVLKLLDNGIEDTPEYIYNSPERHNLLKCFSINGRVLEIGAMFGSLTDYICTKAKEVVVIEKNKGNQKIIKKKCEQFSNLIIKEIDLVDMSSLGNFDYIVIHDIVGILKKTFVTDSDSIISFLNKLYDMLNNSGKLYLDCENRLGMKYLAGAIEEYSKKRFSSINRFKNYDFLRTYTKEELELICESSMFAKYKFYYPFPNSYFPSEIHSDYSLNFLRFSTFSTNNYIQDFVEYNWVNIMKECPGSISKYFNNSFFIELSKLENQNIIYCDFKTIDNYTIYKTAEDKIEVKTYNNNKVYKSIIPSISNRIDEKILKEIGINNILDPKIHIDIFVKYIGQLFKLIDEHSLSNYTYTFRDIYLLGENILFIESLNKQQFLFIVNSLIANFSWLLKERDYRTLTGIIEQKYNINLQINSFQDYSCLIINPIIEENDYIKYTTKETYIKRKNDLEKKIIYDYFFNNKKDRFKEYIEDHLKELENQYNIKIIFWSLRSSVNMGIYRKNSDIDIYFTFISDEYDIIHDLESHTFDYWGVNAIDVKKTIDMNIKAFNKLGFKNYNPAYIDKMHKRAGCNYFYSLFFAVNETFINNEFANDQFCNEIKTFNKDIVISQFQSGLKDKILQIIKMETVPINTYLRTIWNCLFIVHLRNDGLPGDYNLKNLIEKYIENIEFKSLLLKKLQLYFDYALNKDDLKEKNIYIEKYLINYIRGDIFEKD